MSPGKTSRHKVAVSRALPLRRLGVLGGGALLLSAVAFWPVWGPSNDPGSQQVATDVPSSEATVRTAATETTPGTQGSTGSGSSKSAGSQGSLETSQPDTPAASDGADRSEAERALDEQMRRYAAGQRRLERLFSKREKVNLQPFAFQVASFNVLGDSHTGPGGNKPGFADASARMNTAISILRAQGIDVVGFQEFESTQYNMFSARAGEFATYPGLSAGNKSVRFNIAWRASVWEFVEGHTIAIPYAGGSQIDMPVVLLKSRDTGRFAWFANFHNPADTPSLGSNARWRAIGSDIEVAHLTQLHHETGHPVVVTGDFNERAEIFCKFTAGGVFGAAAGGSIGAACAPPSGMGVDWIFGSQMVGFGDYAVVGTSGASDHAMVRAEATLLAQDAVTG